MYREYKWDLIQQNYSDYLTKFSPAYLQGCTWYLVLGDNFKKGYMNFLINDFIKRYIFFCGILQVVFIFALNKRYTHCRL